MTQALAEEPAAGTGGGLQPPRPLPRPRRRFGVIFGKTLGKDGGDLRPRRGREAPRQRRAGCLAKPWLLIFKYPPGPPFPAPNFQGMESHRLRCSEEGHVGITSGPQPARWDGHSEGEWRWPEGLNLLSRSRERAGSFPA